MRHFQNKLLTCCLLILSMIIGILPLPMNVLGADSFSRLWGQSQYDTAKVIGEKVNSSPQNVVLASGRGFADALAAGSLAYSLKAPILLVEKDPADSGAAMSFISQHLAPQGTVWLIGGTAVINSNFENKLTQLGYGTKRIGGYDQYETAALTAQAYQVQKGSPIVIASGQNFPDALSFSSIAAARGWPILLVPKDGLPTAVKDYIVRLQPETIYIAGGTGAVGAGVESAIRQISEVKSAQIKRFAGYDLYETAALILEQFASSPSQIYIASGNNYPDALAGSVLAAQSGAPIVLVNSYQSTLPLTINRYLSQIPKNTGVTVLGGEKVISDSLAAHIIKSIGQPVSNQEFSFDNIGLGATESDLITEFGQPQRKDLSEYGFQWYIYNSDYRDYLQVGISNGKVVAFYTGADNWQSLKGVKIGAARSFVDQVYPLSSKRIGIPKDEEYKTYLVDNAYTTMFYDLNDSDTVSGILILAKTIGDQISSYYGTASTALQTAYEREAFDLANVVRVRKGLTPFIWNDTIAQTAQKHSADMAANNYFSHTTLQGLSPFDRMKADGIKYSRAGENIAAGQTNALFVHHGWMNSSGHRSNILGDYTRLGVGVAFGGSYKIYYTQNFYTPLN